MAKCGGILLDHSGPQILNIRMHLDESQANKERAALIREDSGPSDKDKMRDMGENQLKRDLQLKMKLEALRKDDPNIYPLF